MIVVMVMIIVMVIMAIVLRFRSRLQVFEGFVLGIDKGKFRYGKEFMGKGKRRERERERKKSTRYETRQMRNRRVRTTEKESLPFLSLF